jgi:hypothetical protein
MVQLCSIEQAVDDVLARLPAHIHMGLPLGLGKPNHFVNALYQRIAQLPQRRLTIYTALCLGRPRWVTGCKSVSSNPSPNAFSAITRTGFPCRPASRQLAAQHPYPAVFHAARQSAAQ